MKRPTGVNLDGVIYTNNNGDLGHNQFMDAFLEFIESNGWSFGGGSFQIDEEGEQIEDID
ncbi:YggL 50S ribosome-binding family protein [Aquibacillus kalidii]|uniref:hypothetical protein n=1 Tax=Aquibacillus kalidii TaxID=2762597 RepID=UPI00164501AA|nr:hypothetical protein [Aquibacillus kalidii]